MNQEQLKLFEKYKEKLQRNYVEKPLKRGELPPKEDIILLFLTENLKKCYVTSILGVSEDRFNKYCKKYNIKKPRSLVHEQTKRDYFKKTGYVNPGQDPNVIIARENTMLKRYGVRYCSQINNHKEKVKQTCLNRYGVEHASQSNEIKQKHKETNIKKYGVEYTFQSESVKLKIKETNLEKYGVEYASQNNEIKSKTRQTNLSRYGVEWTQQNKQVRAKSIERFKENYGFDNPSKSPEIKQKIKESNLRKYGVEYAAGSPIVREKIMKTNLQRFGFKCNFSDKECREKSRQTWLQKYGVDNPSKRIEYKEICKNNKQSRIDKNYKTKSKNNSFNTSKPEEEIFEKLKEIFEVKRNYKSIKYPFACDFYIPSLDLYIELNFMWTHGIAPFDINNKKHQEILKKWNEKAKESNFYKNAIYTWTDLDVRKQKIAHDNQLNYLTFYNKKSFYQWFNNSPLFFIKVK